VTVVAVLSLDAASVALAPVFEAYSDARVTLERAVPLGSVAPRAWVSGVPAGEVGPAVEACPTVAAARVLQESDWGTLVGVAWDEPDRFFETLVRTDGTCLRGVGTADGWRLLLRFTARSDLADCYRRCADRGTTVRVESVRTPAGTDHRGPAGTLTGYQREALAVAHEAGYFAVPREATLADVAGELGVSDTAASERIRRGIAGLLDETLPDER
jgi:hypothetical protein